MGKINKSDFVEQMAAKLKLSYSQFERILNAQTEFIYQALTEGNSVSISGFGQFSVSHRASRIGVNPRQPAQKIQIPELNTPKFRAGEAFKEAIKLKA
jgi:nucleoid DNA-binding protein